MSNTIRNKLLAAACTVALLFAVVLTVEAQTVEPIMEDEFVASVQLDAHVYVVRAEYLQALVERFHCPAVVQPFSQLIGTLPPAGPDSLVSIEGAEACPQMQLVLEALGYHTTELVPSNVPAAGPTAQVHTL